MSTSSTTAQLKLPESSRSGAATASTPTATSKAQSPTSLHDVVLDYIITNAYVSTAQSLLQHQQQRRDRGTASSSSGELAKKSQGGEGAGSNSNGNGNGHGHFTIDKDADGDVSMGEPTLVGGSSTHDINGRDKEAQNGEGVKSEGREIDQLTIQSIERRRAIINHILNGAIMRALDALNTHYPSVLLEPAPGSSTQSFAHGSGNGGMNGNSNGNGNGISKGNGNGHAHTSLHTAPPWSSYLPPASSSSSSLFSTSALGAAFSSSKTHSHPSAQHAQSSIHPSPSSPAHAVPVMPYSTQPQHIRLNLQIQQFIESFRQIAPSSPSSPSSSISSLTSSHHQLGTSGMLAPSAGSSSGVTLTHALTAAQGLHAEAKKLPADDRAVYLQEIKDVGALFAYSEPETSILKGFLEQSRRIALAEQVNRAILHSEGNATNSLLETFARRTAGIYAIMHSKVLEMSPPWTAMDGEGKQRLAMWMRSQNKGFRFSDYVSDSWH